MQDKTFSKAVDRARLALVDRGLIAGSEDIELSAVLTEAEYSGGSVALGAAIAVCSSARGFRLDAYTSFTGDINLKGDEWVVQRVEGIQAKLQAAQESGCRRVFLPKDNEADIPPDVNNRLTIIPVSSIADVLARLLLHSGPAANETL